MGNFAASLDMVSGADIIQLFGRTSKTNEFHRLYIDMQKFEAHTAHRHEFGSPPHRVNISGTRYDAKPDEIAGPRQTPLVFLKNMRRRAK